MRPVLQPGGSEVVDVDGFPELNVDLLLHHLLELRAGPPVQGKPAALPELQVSLLCHHVRDVFQEQPMLLEVDGPMKVCGDIHGQYFDLLRFFEYGGSPEEANYLFL